MRTIVVSPAIQLNNDLSYLVKSKKLINSYLKFTNFDILILTNNVDFYRDIDSNRVKIISYEDNFNEPIISGKKFNMHIKRLPIKLASKMDYDIIYHHDCDCFIDGWDENSYNDLISQNYDIYFTGYRSQRPQLGGLRRNYKHFQDKIDKEFHGLYYEELDNAPNPSETKVIFKNKEKLIKFLEFWDKISENNKNFFTYHCGVYIGTSSVYAQNIASCVIPSHTFSEYGRISHGNKILDYFGNVINR